MNLFVGLVVICLKFVRAVLELFIVVCCPPSVVVLWLQADEGAGRRFALRDGRI